jgi:Late exocytosis, associated with Golgi transport
VLQDSSIFATGDQTVATCANSTNPICYNTAVSGSNIVAGYVGGAGFSCITFSVTMSIGRPSCRLWFSSLLGLLCYIGFVVFRTKFRLYFARLDMPQVSRKPPEMRTDGHHRFWSWLVPVFAVSDDDLLASAGLDALVAMRIISFGMMLFLPVTIVVTAILLPINYNDNYYTNEAEDGNYQDDYTTVFIRLTMSNLTPGTRFMWWVAALIAPL